MNKLIEIIRYEGRHYFTVADLAGRKAIETLAAKLTLLEREILNYPKGNIEINRVGEVAVTLMPDELMQKIKNLV